MTDLSRRSFLIGGTALVAAVTAPAIIRTSWVVEDWVRRDIHEILFAPQTWPPFGPDGFVSLSVFRRRLKDVTPSRQFLLGMGSAGVPALLEQAPALLHWAVNRRARIRWAAMPGNELIFVPEYALDLAVSDELSTAAVEIAGIDHYADGMVESFVEIYNWPGPSKERHSMDVSGRIWPHDWAVARREDLGVQIEGDVEEADCYEGPTGAIPFLDS